MTLCGFLAPDGTYTECQPWEHMPSAQEICEASGKTGLNGIEAEDFLFDQGYVIFYARGVSRRAFVNRNLILMTDAQVDFMIQNLGNANNADQKKEMEDLLHDHEAMSEHSVLSYYEKNIGK